MNNQKVWFITGASKGIGLALTNYLLSQGYAVAATSRSVASLENAITVSPQNLLPLEVDITKDNDVKSAIKKTVERFGKIDVVVNNAGYSLVGSMEEMTDAEFRQTIDVNLFAAVNVLRNAIPYLRNQQSGHIINISSNAGYVGFANATSYNAAKFGLIGISEALFEELKPFNIKVTVVAPGQFRTNFMDSSSMQYVKNKIDVYGIEEAQKMWSNYSGQQIGDPEKLVRILAQVTAMDQPPKRLLLGPDTYELVTKQFQTTLEEFEQWKDITLSTNFD
ncbi:short-chain dehydrogenase [Empedobacter brevis]|uniref:SDR family NAD(P)-dependent oxidoreductase n=1 Tax=Empedobacter brevis TaxID=247 RepID=UPI00131FAF44|nr:SDR family NAD(P)-dependent oxidoreductase [Empedobacter brevis]QHC86014.1 short-chain dehydrogenase [Empedobacter brevis]